MIKLAGDPTTKNAICNHPASFTSFSRSVNPNSSAACERFGANKFWSAYKNAEVTVIRNTEKYRLFLRNDFESLAPNRRVVVIEGRRRALRAGTCYCYCYCSNFHRNLPSRSLQTRRREKVRPKI